MHTVLRLYYQKGYGGLGMLVCGMIVGVVAYVFLFPTKFPQIIPSTPKTGIFKDAVIGCVPEDINNPNAPFVNASGYTYEPDDSSADNLKVTGTTRYRRVKRSVPIQANTFTTANGGEVHWTKGPQVTVEDKQFQVYYPTRWLNSCTESLQERGLCRPETSEQGNISYSYAEGKWTHFYKYGMIVLVHLDDGGSPLVEEGYNNSFSDPQQFYVADVYTDPSKEPLPADVINCKDLPGPGLGILLKNLIPPSPSPTPTPTPVPANARSDDEKQLQLDWFYPTEDIRSGESWRTVWWTPHCKPAVYLYPTKETLVNVQVAVPNGFLLYTDPLYPTNGWTVVAKPSGAIQYLGNDFSDSKGKINYPTGIFPYLYYEAKINDKSITKPEKGFVKTYEELSSFFDETLPTLGLTNKEAAEFKTYWIKALPKSPYYFIGIMQKESIAANEPLIITPKEDSLIRVRLFFEALDSFKLVSKPDIQTPKRVGFTVVDWGGMVKIDKDHPFTCLQ